LPKRNQSLHFRNSIQNTGFGSKSLEIEPLPSSSWIDKDPVRKKYVNISDIYIDIRTSPPRMAHSRARPFLFLGGGFSSIHPHVMKMPNSPIMQVKLGKKGKACPRWRT
jgi:hypothetical protein